MEPSIKKKLEIFSDTLEFFRHELKGEIQAQQLVVLLLIYNNKDITMLDIINKTGLSQSTISRNIALLLEWFNYSKRQAGAGIVNIYEDPMDRRRKVIELTAKGKALFARLEKYLASPNPTKLLKK